MKINKNEPAKTEKRALLIYNFSGLTPVPTTIASDENIKIDDYQKIMLQQRKEGRVIADSAFLSVLHLKVINQHMGSDCRSSLLLSRCRPLLPHNRPPYIQYM
jgi:hypothetical protein